MASKLLSIPHKEIELLLAVAQYYLSYTLLQFDVGVVLENVFICLVILITVIIVIPLMIDN